MLCAFSIRCQFVEKSYIYSKIGTKLFPENSDIFEIYGLSLLYKKQYTELDEELRSIEFETPNISYLRSRLSILTDSEDKSRHVRDYLRVRK